MFWFRSNDREALVAAVMNELDREPELPEYWIVQDASGAEETVILLGESEQGFTPNIIVSWNTSEGVRDAAASGLPPITVCEHEEVVGDSGRGWKLNIFLADGDYYVEESLSVRDSKGSRNIRFSSNSSGRPFMRRIVDRFAAQALLERETGNDG